MVGMQPRHASEFRSMPGPRAGLGAALLLPWFLLACTLTTEPPIEPTAGPAANARVLPPRVGALIQNTFSRLPDGWRLDQARIDRAHVTATLCPTDPDPQCVALVLTDPLACPAPPVGPWCLEFPDRPPPRDLLEALTGLLAADGDAQIWLALGNDSDGRQGEQAPVRATPPSTADVARLLADNVSRGALPPGWTLGIAPPRPGASPFAFASLTATGPDDRLDLELLGKAAGEWATCSRNYCIDLAGQPPDTMGPTQVAAVLDPLGRRLLAHDAPAPFAQPLVMPWRIFLVLLLLLALAASAHTAIGALRAGPRPTAALLGLAAATALALALRFLLSPWAFQHEFGYVAQRLNLINGGPLSTYGEAGHALPAVLNLLFGGQERTLFATNAIFATLTVPLVGLLDWLLFGRWGRAVFAAFVMALIPQHLRFSASGVASLPLAFFSLWALVMVLAYLRRQSLFTLVGATLALFLAMRTRPEFALWPLGILALLLLTRPVRDWSPLLTRHTLGALGLLVGLTGIRFLCFPGTPEPPDPEMALAAHQFAFWNPRLTPMVLQATCVAGIAWGLARAWRPTVWLLGTALGMTLFYLYFFGNEVYTLRTQAALSPLYACLCGGAAQLLLDLPVRRGLRLGAVALLALGVATAPLTHANVVREELLTNQEFLFLRQTLPGLPDGPGVALVAAKTTAHAFPRVLLADTGRLLRFESIGMPGARTPNRPLTRRTLFYRGLYCYAHVFHEGGEDPESALCRSVRESCDLQPLRTTTITGRPGPSGLYTPPGTHRDDEVTLEIGFYAIKDCRPPG